MYKTRLHVDEFVNFIGVISRDEYHGSILKKADIHSSFVVDTKNT